MSAKTPNTAPAATAAAPRARLETFSVTSALASSISSRTRTETLLGDLRDGAARLSDCSGSQRARRLRIRARTRPPANAPPTPTLGTVGRERGGETRGRALTGRQLRGRRRGSRRRRRRGISGREGGRRRGSSRRSGGRLRRRGGRLRRRGGRLRRGDGRRRRCRSRLGRGSRRLVRGRGRLVGHERGGLVPSRLPRWLLAGGWSVTQGALRRTHASRSAPPRASTRALASAPNPASRPDHRGA